MNDRFAGGRIRNLQYLKDAALLEISSVVRKQPVDISIRPARMRICRTFRSARVFDDDDPALVVRLDAFEAAAAEHSRYILHNGRKSCSRLPRRTASPRHGWQMPDTGES